MANNYTPSYNQYLTQSAGYTLPSNVRTYSVFDPASNTWRRMTNDGMSPMPQGNQADIQAVLAQARQTQGTVYPAQGMGQGQPVEMHPGYLNPPVQTPAQMPSGGSRTPSPASEASQKQAPVYTGGGYAEVRKPYPDPNADTAFLEEEPVGVTPQRRVPNITVIPRGTQNPNTASNPTNVAQNNLNILDTISSNPYVAYNPFILGPRLMQKSVVPYAKSAVKAYNDLTNAGAQKLRDWHYGFLNWLNN